MSETAYDELIYEVSRSGIGKSISADASFVAAGLPPLVETTLGAAAEPWMFASLIDTLIDSSKTRFEELLGKYDAYFDCHPKVLQGLLGGRLNSQVSEFLVRPLVHHIKSDRVQAALSEASAEGRYAEYCNRWSRDFAEDFFLAYPLAQYICEVLTKAFIDFLDEMFGRVTSIPQEVLGTVIPNHPALKIRGIEFVGDRHNGGRCGAVFDLEAGKFVYKSRSTDGEAAFASLCSWIQGRGGPIVHSPAALAYDGWGVVEFVQPDISAIDDPVFLHRCGTLAGLFYATQANDMHLENIIPTKTTPIPIDLETVLHPVEVTDNLTVRPPKNNAVAYTLRCVSSSGILPTRLGRPGDKSEYLDIGFLNGGDSGIPFKSLHIENAFRDDAIVRFSHISARSSASGSVNSESEDTARDRDFHRAINFAAGFEEMYRWILGNRSALKLKIAEIFNGVSLRVVLAPTVIYAQILRMLSSPEALSSKDTFVSVCLRTAAMEDRSISLCLAEARSLINLDIPFFMHASNSHEITSIGDPCTTGMLIRDNALYEALEALDAWGEIDLEQQLDQIWSAFMSPYPCNQLELNAPSRRTSEGGYRDLCARLAERLLQQQRPGATEDAPWTWVAPVPGTRYEHSDAWATRPLTYDLYSGVLGPAMALARCACLLEDERYRTAAYRVLEPFSRAGAASRFAREFPPAIRASAMMGAAGAAYALKQAGDILHDDRLSDSTAELADISVQELCSLEMDSADFLTGSVGAVAMLLGNNIVSNRASLVEILERHAERIINGQVDSEWWSQSGFAHGISGSLYTIGRWGNLFQNRDLAIAALNHLLERLDQFSADEGGWLSRTGFTASNTAGWCHGSSGILLALSTVATHIPESRVSRSSLERALVHSTKIGIGRNLTLCHGDLGTIDLLEWVSRLPGTPEQLRWDPRSYIDGYDPEALCKVLGDRSIRYSTNPSLMVGYSGVALWAANRVSSNCLNLPIIPEAA